MRTKRYEHFLLRFYNEMCGGNAERFEDIPDRAKEILAYLDYEEIVTPFAAMDLHQGHSRVQVANRYCIKLHRARRIGMKYGVYKKRTRR